MCLMWTGVLQGLEVLFYTRAAACLGGKTSWCQVFVQSSYLIKRKDYSFPTLRFSSVSAGSHSSFVPPPAAKFGWHSEDPTQPEHRRKPPRKPPWNRLSQKQESVQWGRRKPERWRRRRRRGRRWRRKRKRRIGKIGGGGGPAKVSVIDRQQSQKHLRLNISLTVWHLFSSVLQLAQQWWRHDGLCSMAVRRPQKCEETSACKENSELWSGLRFWGELRTVRRP